MTPPTSPPVTALPAAPPEAAGSSTAADSAQAERTVLHRYAYRPLPLWLQGLRDFVLPRWCARCDARLALDDDTLCEECRLTLPRTFLWQKKDTNKVAIQFRLAFRKATETKTNGKEVTVTAHHQPIENAAVFMQYKPGTLTSRIVKRFKYYGYPDIAVGIGRMIGRELSATGFFNGIDIIVALPLTPNHRQRRGYNQSWMLAKGISQTTGLLVADDQSVAVRNRSSKSQTRMSHRGRKENVRDAFSVDAAGATQCAGKHLLLIDDIFTTGSTTMACVDALATIPNVRISVLALGFARDEYREF